jgi:hypothetical protein
MTEVPPGRLLAERSFLLDLLKAIIHVERRIKKESL